MKCDLFCLIVAGVLLISGVGRRAPKDGVTVRYGFCGNEVVFKTTNRFVVSVTTSNGPCIDAVWGVWSVPIYETIQIWKTNRLW